ncbi:MAG: crossover junction endodeoxyribonuclease RuvC [Patescibacteria group bacterium]|nr:crossover junction endodeoxyribonuclease RuvC [Patescibacteria group bacterium]
MIILGIDPGTHRMGYGLIRTMRDDCQYIDAGLLSVSHHEPHLALHDLKISLDTIIATTHPDGIAVEKIFFSKNKTTGIAVAQARGIVLLAAAEHKILLAEFSPNEVKSHLTGYGLADKTSMAKMVRLILHCPSLSIIDDATDALSIAIAAHFSKSFEKNIQR